MSYIVASQYLYQLLSHIPVPDFSEMDLELAKLEEQEDAKEVEQLICQHLRLLRSSAFHY
ncbi:hypothetical protein EK21DRAFT_82216 [Setomelanomma holmii]|uniref:Uncharacterized protein n=1 Tax=Setomelanomma holmii TaxID=210430 RepID=A0A9P4GW72_9PLEO|nr:hypothetical protein EK21DRAFT_82216 [Setomelanomma holmii]